MDAMRHEIASAGAGSCEQEVDETLIGLTGPGAAGDTQYESAARRQDEAGERPAPVRCEKPLPAVLLQTLADGPDWRHRRGRRASQWRKASKLRATWSSWAQKPPDSLGMTRQASFASHNGTSIEQIPDRALSFPVCCHSVHGRTRTRFRLPFPPSINRSLTLAAVAPALASFMPAPCGYRWASRLDMLRMEPRSDSLIPGRLPTVYNSRQIVRSPRADESVRTAGSVYFTTSSIIAKEGSGVSYCGS